MLVLYVCVFLISSVVVPLALREIGNRMGRSKGTGVWGAVYEQIDYLKRASRHNGWGIKASSEYQTLKIKCFGIYLDDACYMLGTE